MHVAAGLGKPIVCLFGQSSAERWHPWGTAYALLQMPSMQVKDISVDAVARAYAALPGGGFK
jgi:ADP-heptose:LPS heptosyltransferase